MKSNVNHGKSNRGVWAVLGVLLGLAGCGTPEAHSYDNNDLQLLTRYAAREMCSCMFVMGQTEDFCLRWTRASPNLRTVTVNRGDRTVEAQAVLFWGARARFVSRREGCVLE